MITNAHTCGHISIHTHTYKKRRNQGKEIYQNVKSSYRVLFLELVGYFFLIHSCVFYVVYKVLMLRKEIEREKNELHQLSLHWELENVGE